jgi:hypothetical protein
MAADIAGDMVLPIIRWALGDLDGAEYRLLGQPTQKPGGWAGTSAPRRLAALSLEKSQFKRASGKLGWIDFRLD